jgi:hypothetical protein
MLRCEGAKVYCSRTRRRAQHHWEATAAPGEEVWNWSCCSHSDSAGLALCISEQGFVLYVSEQGAVASRRMGGASKIYRQQASHGHGHCLQQFQSWLYVAASQGQYRAYKCVKCLVWRSRANSASPQRWCLSTRGRRRARRLGAQHH